MIIATVFANRSTETWNAYVFYTQTGVFCGVYGGSDEQDMKEIVQREHKGAMFVTRQQLMRRYHL